MSAAQGDLRVQRWAPAVFDIPCEGFDLSQDILTLQVRAYRDAPGAPLINLTQSSASFEGLSANLNIINGLPVTTIQVRIYEETIESILTFPDNGVEPNGNVVLAYALHVGENFSKRRFLEGAFIIEPGANQA